jgi:hypothetical protein
MTTRDRRTVGDICIEYLPDGVCLVPLPGNAQPVRTSVGALLLRTRGRVALVDLGPPAIDPAEDARRKRLGTAGGSLTDPGELASGISWRGRHATLVAGSARCNTGVDGRAFGSDIDTMGSARQTTPAVRPGRMPDLMVAVAD